MTDDAARPTTDGSSARLYLLGAVVAVSVPFCAAEFVPITDMPQHLAQIRLVEELLGLRAASIDLSTLELHPFGAHTLVYWPLFLVSRALPLIAAGKLTVALLLCATVFAMFQLASVRGRDPVHAAIATLPLFNVSLYWGFLNFMSGAPLLLWFVARLARMEQQEPARRMVFDALLLAALLWAHVFWLPVAALAVVVFAIERRDLRWFLRRGLCFAPVAILVARWYPGLVEARARAGFSLATYYLVAPLDRLTWTWLVETLFGGIRGFVEPLFTALLVAYIAWVVLAAKRASALRVDRPLLALASLLICFALFAPDQHLNTILVNRRFLSPGIALLLVSLPETRDRIARAAASLALAIFALFTAFAWALYDQDDLAGLRESLESVPEGSSVLGLNYREASVYIRGNPFLQTFAYAQALRGGDVAFSFAEHASSIVTYRAPRRIRWTPGLEWLPERATERDIAAFRCCLVNARPDRHAQFAQRFGMTAANNQGYFRLYCRP